MTKNKNKKSRESEEKTCKICSAKATLTCSNCNKITYCSKECQKQHWKEHKNECKPFNVQKSNLFGRYLVASKDIKAGELILKEAPIIVGPSITCAPLCLNCYKLIDLLRNPIFCLKCNVAPLCSVNCISKPNGHTAQECEELRSNLYISAEKLMQHYPVATPMRCLLLRKNDPKLWDEFIKMEQHMEKRRNTSIWRNYKYNVETILHKFNFVSDDDITEELVQKICGILDVNTFELRVPGFEQNWSRSLNNNESIRGVFLQAAMMAHDCVGNTYLATDDEFNLIIHASVDIAKNTPIYFNYTNALNGTFDRQEHLREGKYFTCTCKRCLDTSECGTYMSSILCVKCRQGAVIPLRTPSSVDQDLHSQNTIWRCSKDNCDYKCNGLLIASTVNCTKRLVEETDKTDIQSVESLLKKLLHSFSLQHSIILDLKQCLVGLYSEVLRREVNPSRKYLSRKLQLCKDLLPVIEIVEPGISRLIGITLYEMHIPMVILANREYDGGEISAEELLGRLSQAEEALKKAVSYLLYEPTASPEGRLASRAMNELKLLRKNSSNVEQIVTNKKHKVPEKRKKNKK